MACKKCWHPEMGQHNDGCPEAGGNQAEWDRGYMVAMDGEVLLPRELRYYPPPFRLGYRVGYLIIEDLIYQNTGQL